MEYRMLGRTGVEVTPLCLGAMMFGAWGNTDHAECRRIMHAAVDAGINFIDTADVYSAGESEKIVGAFLAELGPDRREDIVLATKFHARMGEGPNREGNSRRWIISECEASLRRLGTDYIDLYQIHRPNPGTDIDDTLSALSDLVHSGKIRYFGSSTFPAWAVVEAHWVSLQRGRERLSTEQPPYSMLARGIETRSPARLPAIRDGRAQLEPARRRLALRPLRDGQGQQLPARVAHAERVTTSTTRATQQSWPRWTN